MTDLELRLYIALKRITCYDPPARLRKRAEKDYGLSGDEAIEYAYENIQQEARDAIKGVRRPKGKPSCTGASR
ncbi:hypothetical protein AQ808_23990 [Burkholderia pseudomallei]|uniref:hypothetical protein n=1 Tax=Burkholderia pseudomallei TaxID=28450 RepID=UPI000572228E|nr:hypothetical protein [Burkholderia pseudomallei]OMW45738.1 hypothetical protein AQ808_23990 [Burkholderia pseudomallei]